VFTHAGGALFGFWEGTLVVSFASAIGRTLACLISRFLLRDWVQSSFKDKLLPINKGIKEEGALMQRFRLDKIEKAVLLIQQEGGNC